MSSGQRLELLESNALYGPALEIILALKGHQSVFAGGCVRDSLLGVSPKDVDIATSAPPEVVEATFEHTLAVGKAFGTIVVVKDGHNYEVTTFRSDGAYLDGRHPSKIEYSDIREDAARRDFTVNALFYDPIKHEVLDYVGGIADIKQKKLRTVGRADDRFREDRLRMLRAVRFVAQLDFDLDPSALQAIRKDAAELAKVSNERIFNELKRLLESKHVEKGLQALMLSGLDRVAWPELNGVDLKRLADFPRLATWEEAFAALMLLSKHEDPEPRLREWKTSRESMRNVKQLMNDVRALPKLSFADRARVFGGALSASAIAVSQGINGKTSTTKWMSEHQQRVSDKFGVLPAPFLNGEDLRAAGIAPGARMGELLKLAYDAQLEGRVQDKDSALKLIKA